MSVNSAGFVLSSGGGKVVGVRFSESQIELLDKLQELSEKGEISVELGTRSDVVRWLCGIGAEVVLEELRSSGKIEPEWLEVMRKEREIAKLVWIAMQRLNIMALAERVVQTAIELGKELGPEARERFMQEVRELVDREPSEFWRKLFIKKLEGMM